jgi:hypothetical protein
VCDRRAGGAETEAARGAVGGVSRARAPARTTGMLLGERLPALRTARSAAASNEATRALRWQGAVGGRHLGRRARRVEHGTYQANGNNSKKLVGFETRTCRW